MGGGVSWAWLRALAEVDGRLVLLVVRLEHVLVRRRFLGEDPSGLAVIVAVVVSAAAPVDGRLGLCRGRRAVAVGRALPLAVEFQAGLTP